MAASPVHPPHHRKQTLKIAKLLSKEDVDEMLYLSEDFIPEDERAKITNGVELMRSLERHKRLGPGNTSYLFSCLKEIGREDLASVLSQNQLMTSSLQPVSYTLGMPYQLLQVKLSVVHSKQSKFAQQMRHMNTLTRSKLHWEEEWSGLFQGLMHCMDDVHPLPPPDDVHMVLSDTLDYIFGIVHAQTSALVHFQTAGNHIVATRYLQEANRIYKKLYSTFQSIQWTKRKEGGVMTQASVASETCSFVTDFLSELLGKQAVVNEAEKLSDTLNTIESLAFVAGHGLNVLQWLFTIVHMALTYSLDLSPYQAQLRSTAALLLRKGITHHNHLLQHLLGGTKIFETVKRNGLLNEVPEENLDASASMIQNCPVFVTLYVNLTVLLHFSEATSSDWSQIKTNFREKEKKFAKMYSHEVRIVFQELCSEVDSFLEDTVDTALKQAPGLQEIIKGMLHY